MDWLEWARTVEFLAIWKNTFADVADLLAGAPRTRASDRAYAEKEALWVEIREPLDGVRLITMELRTDIRPPRVYLRVWTYQLQGALVYKSLEHRRYLWQGKPVTRYLNDQPQPSWQRQLDAAGVKVNGIRHYLDLSELAEAPPSEIPQRLHAVLKSFCQYVAMSAAGDISLDVPAPSPSKTSLEASPPAPVPETRPGVDVGSATEVVSKLAPDVTPEVPTKATVVDSTGEGAQVPEFLAPEVKDLLHIDEDPRFSQEPLPIRVAAANARIGQGGYRQRMLELWGRRCAMTGCPVEAVLIASHARSWSLCETAQQCLDEYNGLLLSANLDRLFDQGLISFTDEGEVITRGESAIDAMVTADRLRFVDPRHVEYLAWHRNRFGFD